MNKKLSAKQLLITGTVALLLSAFLEKDIFSGNALDTLGTLLNDPLSLIGLLIGLIGIILIMYGLVASFKQNK